MTKKLETKEFKFTIDDMDEEKGVFSGYASIFGVVDSQGDMVLPGAFKKTLREKKQFPMLWSHNIMEPIGIIGGEEDEKGLRVDGQINLDVQRSREIRSLMKQRAVNGLSIGFVAIKEGVDKDTQVRLLKEINLWEISPCVFQACPDAEVIDVKTSIEFKPNPNEHAARLIDPDKFDRFRRKADGKLYNKIKVPETVDVIWGHLEGGADDEWAAQALRFPTADWTEAEARKWLKDNDVKYVDFEPAKEPEKSTPRIKPEAIHLIDNMIARIKVYQKSIKGGYIA